MTSPLKGKRILVTGGAGFLGRHVCRRLEQCEPAEVIVPRSNVNDLRRHEDATALFVQQVDIVIHLAARCGGIGANRAAPDGFLRDNLLMGLHVMDAARAAGVEKFVLVGTACSYPRDAPTPLQESSLWDGYPEATNAPYGIAKRTLIEYGLALHRQYGFPVVNLIPANLYGPGDNFDLEMSHVIPALIRKCIEARDAGTPTVTAWGTGSATRDFLYVEDAADGIVRAAESHADPAPVNLGTGQPVSIGAVALLVRMATRFRGEIAWDRSKPDGQPSRCLDTRAAAAFGWRAQTPLVEGLRRTVEWYERERRSSYE